MSISVGSILSVELLFWLPTLLDLLLLIIIYSNCQWNGINWYLKTQQQQPSSSDSNNTKKKNDGDDDSSKPNEIIILDDCNKLPAGSPALATLLKVWEFGMMAYSTYAVLFPFAIYNCYVRPEVRVSFCWAMTLIMCEKIRYFWAENAKHQESTKNQQALTSLYYFYLPTYGGYAIWKSFFA